MTLDPKEHFQKWQSDSCSNLKQTVPAGWFKSSLVFALALMVDEGATSEQLSGARMFIASLENLTTDKLEMKKLPVKTLSTYETQPPAKASTAK